MKYIEARTLIWLVACLLFARPAQPADAAELQLSDTFVRKAVSVTAYAQALGSDTSFEVAQILLDTALKLNPENAQAWAMRVEMAEAVGDQEMYEKALVRYLATGIRDDRASYELIQYRLAKENPTLDGQLRKLEDLLDGPGGRGLNGPLRSRLASHATSLAKELLDEKARRKWAVEAARSDPANAEAAAEMLSLVNELTQDTLRRGTATVNLVRADPLNPAPRLALSRILAKEGIYERAAQQYQVVATRLSRQPLALEAYIEWAHCLVITGQDELALQLISQYERALQPQNTQPAGEGQDTAQTKTPEPVALPVELELVRLALLDGDDQRGEAQAIFDRVLKTFATPDDAGDQLKTVVVDQRAVVAALFAPDLVQAQAVIDEHQRNEFATEGLNQVAKGWLALRRGEHAKAEQLLGPLANDLPIASCGLALAVGIDDAGRANRLRKAMAGLPATSVVTLAAGRAISKLGQSPKPSDTGLALASLMSKYPPSFWLVDLERTPWIEARIQIEPARINPLEPVAAEITVWNTSRFPIAIGENAAIKPNAMVLISASASGRPVPPPAPIVLDIGRRFTLLANERLTFDTRIDYHQFGELRAANPGAVLIFDARLIVNPAMTPAGTWMPSGIGGTDEARKAFIQSKPAQEAAIDPWIKAITSGVATEKLEALARLAGLSSQSQPDFVTPDLLERLRPKLYEAWGTGTNAERAWILINTIGLDQPDSTSYPKLLELAKQRDDPMIWLALLSSQVDDPDSPLLREAVGRQDMPSVSRFAERLRRLMREIEKAREASQEPEPSQP